MAAAQFMPITGSAINIQDLKPTGLSSDEMSDNVFIQLLDDVGHATTTYFWINYAEDENGNSVEAWVDADDTIANVTFAPGQGLWIQAIDGISLQSSGKVCTSDVSVTLRNNFTAVANPYPTSVQIQEILPTGLLSNQLSDNVFIQLLDDVGHATTTYFWIDYAENESGDTVEAWVDADDAIADVNFAPGQGLWVQAIDGASLRFPAPEL